MTIISAMNPERKCEFEVSCILRCWGDELDFEKLGDDLNLNSEYCRVINKGEGIGKSGCDFKGRAKTSSFSYGCLDEFPDWKRLPYKQIEHICNALSSLEDNTLFSYKVWKAEFQISCYYGNRTEEGHVEIFFENKVVDLLSKHNVSLRNTILP